jgi:hypothetical protein
MPWPDLKTAVTFGSSRNMAASSSNPPAMKAGPVSSANTIDCSGFIENRPVARS